MFLKMWDQMNSAVVFSLIGRASKIIRTNGSWNQVGVLGNRIMRNDGSWNQCRVVL
jgi:hypothetical protein